MPRARIIALGQPVAGDDGVGPAVLARLRAGGVPPDVELVAATEASALVEGVQLEGPVVIVDALLAEPAGQVLVLSPEDLATGALSPLSSHGLSAGGAIALARVLAPGALSPRIAVVAVTILPPGRYREGLSPGVGEALDAAAAAVLRCVSGG
jgi:hydrogenase maturation protease